SILLASGGLARAQNAQLDLVQQGTVSQSGAGSPQPASQAIDGNSATFSETTNVANSFWELELARAFRISRIDLIAPSGVPYTGVVNGLVMRVFNLRDQLVFQQTV